MKRALFVIMALSLCAAAGCAVKYGRMAKGVSRTVCEVWIYSFPQGARLYADDEYVGRTPYKYIAINEGDSSAHFIAQNVPELTVRKRGYYEEAQVITIANCYKKLNIKNEGVNDQVKTYKGHITLYLDEKEYYAKSRFGNIMIKVSPEDKEAEIYLNDSLIGNGKTSLLKLPEGSYVLKVRKPGYAPYARIISVLPDNDVTVTANLVELPEGHEEITMIEAEAIELTPAGLEAELEDDEMPGTVGGRE